MRPGLRSLAAVLVAGWLVAWPSALAAEAPGSGPSVSGSVSGGLSEGGHLTVRITAVEPEGWQSLHELEARLVVGGQVAERITFDIEDQLLTVGGQIIAVGTGAGGSGAYFSAAGSDVIVTTGGARFEFAVKLEVLQDVPSSARFRLEAVDDFGRTASVTRVANAGSTSGGGLSWSSLVLAVALALFAGGFLGNTFASRRRPAARKSIYSTIQRRIEEERQEAGSSAEPAP